MPKISYKRNSFDRFCDDLCEEILQYLSFEDKIRFECVSKQFRCCVFARQFVLESHRYYLFNSLNSLPANKLYSYSRQQRFVSEAIVNPISNFERVLRKCKKINCVILENNSEFMPFDKLLRVIIDNCNDLIAITVYYTKCVQISDMTLNEFGAKFGKFLRKINLGFHQLIRFCPNIVSICEINIWDLISSDVLLPKLSEVRNIKGCDDSYSMDIFVKRHRNTMRVFETQYSGGNCYQFMTQLSRFANLEYLSLGMDYYVNQSEFSRGLMSVAVKSKLKHFRLNLRNQNDCIEILNAINCFAELKSLRLNLRYITDSVELIRNCKNLTRLEVGDVIDDKFFTDIDKYLPKLTTVKITSMGGEYRITNKTLNFLSRLELLRVIDLKTYNGYSKSDNLNITHTSICNVLDSCTHFRSFSFDCCPQITAQTIRVLIDIAKSRSRINFNHYFGIYSIETHQTISSAINKYGLPCNLKITNPYLM